MNPTQNANAFACVLSGERVWQLQCRPITVKRHLRTEANAVVSECAVRYRVVAY